MINFFQKIFAKEIPEVDEILNIILNHTKRGHVTKNLLNPSIIENLDEISNLIKSKNKQIFYLKITELGKSLKNLIKNKKYLEHYINLENFTFYTKEYETEIIYEISNINSDIEKLNIELTPLILELQKIVFENLTYRLFDSKTSKTFSIISEIENKTSRVIAILKGEGEYNHETLEKIPSSTKL